MQLAQRLYEGVDLGQRGQIGLITYMRTDSVRVSGESVDAARQVIAGRFGETVLPEKPRSYANKSASQDAHEAIRPTDPTLRPEDLSSVLKPDELRLYRLIWERFLASQMKDAIFDITQVEVAAGEYTLAVTGKILREAGFLSLWQELENGDGNGDDRKNAKLPPGLKEDQEIACTSVKLEQKWTQPPARYGEATLVKALEENGIGRPSTYASILATLASRDYTVREKNSFRPTELGKLVNRLLIGSFASIINEAYTASLEEDLDRVADGQRGWKDLVRRFSAAFTRDLEKARDQMEQVKGRGVPTDQICPECSSPLVMKFGRYGEFLACSAYPECSYTRDLNEQNEVEVDEETPDCPECEAEMVLKRSRFGPFWACSRFPECRGTRRLGGEVAQQPQPTGVSCPRAGCAGEIVQRKSRRGKVFYGCNKYPACDFSMWDPPVENPCPVCNHPIMGLRTTQKRGRELVCPIRDCGHRMPAPEDDDAQHESS
jgi:DNA topoisomerase-1